MPGQSGEREFFQILWLANMLNLPEFLVEQIANLDVRELYTEASNDGLKFNQF